MHCQPHHVVRTTISNPLILDDLLNNIGVKHFQLLSFFENLHDIDVIVVLDLFVPFHMDMLIHDVVPSLSQEIDGILYLLHYLSVFLQDVSIRLFVLY